MVLVLAGGGCCSGLLAQTNKNVPNSWEVPKDGYPVTVEDSGSPEVDALVAQLVSKRPAPFADGNSDPPRAVVFAQDFYATPEVLTALRQLKAKGPAIFPALVIQLRDYRYSYSDVCAAWLNHAVRDAVIEVLCDGQYMHSGYKSRKTPQGSGVYLSFDHYLKSKGAAAWAVWAKAKTRLEIQMDFIDWCLAEEDKRGYVDDEQKTKTHQTYEQARKTVRELYTPTEKPKSEARPPTGQTNSASQPAGSSR
jgi:hypothetical protein